MSPQPVADAQAGPRPIEELQEVGITPRYVGPGSEERNARLDNNPINVIPSGSDATQSSSEVLTSQPSGPEEIVVTAQRLTVPQERLYDRLISPLYGLSEHQAIEEVDRARRYDIRYDNNVSAENDRVAINFGLTMIGGGAAGAFGAALFPTFLASTGSVLQAGVASGVISDVAFQGYQNVLFAGSGGDYGRSGIDGTELALSAGLGALPGLPAAIRGWADDLRGLGVPDWNIRLSPPGTLYSNGIGLELERIGSNSFRPASKSGFTFESKLIPEGELTRIELLSKNAFDAEGRVVESAYRRSELSARLEPGGNVSLDWYSTDISGHNIGREMISTAIETYGPANVRTVSARLGVDNLDAYRVAVDAGADAAQAVWRTPLGKSMRDLGFESVDATQAPHRVLFRY